MLSYCKYINNPNSTINHLLKRNKHEVIKVNKTLPQVLQEKKLRRLPLILSKRHDRFFRIGTPPPFIEFQDKVCTKKNSKSYSSSLKGALYAITYYSILKNILGTDIVKIDNNIKEYNIEKNHIYLNQKQYSNQQQGLNIKPVDLIDNNIEDIVDPTFMSRSYTDSSKDLVAFFVLAKKYKSLYVDTIARLYKEKELINFYNSYPLSYSVQEYLHKYEIPALVDNCFNQEVYLNFSYNNKRTYFVINLHTYLFSFWLRRDLEGSIESTDAILERMINYMKDVD